jgi:hypothetical protein
MGGVTAGSAHVIESDADTTEETACEHACTVTNEMKKQDERGIECTRTVSPV